MNHSKEARARCERRAALAPGEDDRICMYCGAGHRRRSDFCANKCQQAFFRARVRPTTSVYIDPARVVPYMNDGEVRLGFVEAFEWTEDWRRTNRMEVAHG